MSQWMVKLEQIDVRTERKERKKSGVQSPPVGGSELWRRSPPSSNHSRLPRDSIMTSLNNMRRCLSPAPAVRAVPYNTSHLPSTPLQERSNLRQFQKLRNAKVMSIKCNKFNVRIWKLSFTCFGHYWPSSEGIANTTKKYFSCMMNRLS
jgi:hypothetical protein